MKSLFSQWLGENWEKSPEMLKIENPIQIFGNFVHDLHLNDLLHLNRKIGLGFYEISFLPVTGRKGPKIAIQHWGQFFHFSLMRNYQTYGSGNDKFNSSNIWPLRAFSPSDLFSLGERLPSKNSEFFFDSANCFGIPWTRPFLRMRSLSKKKWVPGKLSLLRWM